MKIRRPEDFLIKICGLTCEEDVDAAVAAGANAVGFNFHPFSPRYVDPTRAGALIDHLRAQTGRSVAVFGVVVLSTKTPWQPEPLQALLAELDGLQVHGAGRPADLPDFAGRMLVAVGAEQADTFPGHEILVDDSWGRGVPVRWEEVRELRRPFILAGGLTPENVRSAVRRLRPAGVDVCSGVEAYPGRKDPQKMQRFVEEVRLALRTDYGTAEERVNANHANHDNPMIPMGQGDGDEFSRRNRSA